MGTGFGISFSTSEPYINEEGKLMAIMTITMGDSEHSWPVELNAKNFQVVDGKWKPKDGNDNK